MQVLLAVDRSEPALRALDLVASLDWPEGAVLRVITVAPEMAVAYGGDVEEHLRAFLEDAAGPLVSTGRSVEREVLVGRPASIIVEQAARADLVVMGSHRRGGLGERLLGSTSSEVVASSAAPVLVARTTAVTRVMVTDDGSAAADAAVGCLVQAKVFDRHPIHVVSVIDTDEAVFGSDRPQTSEAVRHEHEERAQRRAEMLRAAGFSDVTTDTPEGEPAVEILRLAEGVGADLIVMGTQGRGGLRGMLSGGVAWSVLHRAGASVLVAKAPSPAEASAPEG